MSLSAEQLAALKAHVVADESLDALPNNSDGNFAIAAILNAPASPDWTIWRTSVPVSDIEQNGFLWSTVDAMTAGKARIWEWMRSAGYIQPHKPNVRQGLADAFGANSAQTTAILPHLKALATRVQKLFSTGTGSNAVPATLAANIPDTFTVSYQDVDTARNLP